MAAFYGGHLLEAARAEISGAQSPDCVSLWVTYDTFYLHWYIVATIRTAERFVVLRSLKGLSLEENPFPYVLLEHVDMKMGVRCFGPSCISQSWELRKGAALASVDLAQPIIWYNIESTHRGSPSLIHCNKSSAINRTCGRSLCKAACICRGKAMSLTYVWFVCPCGTSVSALQEGEGGGIMIGVSVSAVQLRALVTRWSPLPMGSLPESVIRSLWK